MNNSNIPPVLVNFLFMSHYRCSLTSMNPTYLISPEDSLEWVKQGQGQEARVNNARQDLWFGRDRGRSGHLWDVREFMYVGTHSIGKSKTPVYPILHWNPYHLGQPSSLRGFVKGLILLWMGWAKGIIYIMVLLLFQMCFYFWKASESFSK